MSKITRFSHPVARAVTKPKSTFLKLGYVVTREWKWTKWSLSIHVCSREAPREKLTRSGRGGRLASDVLKFLLIPIAVENRTGSRLTTLVGCFCGSFSIVFALPYRSRDAIFAFWRPSSDP